MYYRPLCLYASRFGLGTGPVEDLVQDAFIAYWEKERAGTAPDSPKSYLYRTVHNRCIDALRRAGRELPSEVDPQLPDEEAVDRSFLWARLWTAIDRLPERRRQILLLNKRDGLTCSEIALRMGISEATVRNQLAKALKSLREGRSHIFSLFLCW